MKGSVLADSGYWIGLLDPSDQYHLKSKQIKALIEGYDVVFPWPCLYEVVSTRLARRKKHLEQLESHLAQPGIVLLNDESYRTTALRVALCPNPESSSTLSLTDCIIHEILKDKRFTFNFLLTYNNEDFAEICTLRDISILN